MTRTRTALLGAAALAALATGCGSSSDGAPSAAELAPVKAGYAPKIDPADFGRPIDNRFFPLKPGTRLHYEGVGEDGKETQTDYVTVTTKTKRILGVNCVVVLDVVRVDGEPEERTFDWYTQDKHGNVWYFGEDSYDYKHGRWVRSDGSWTAGVDGAKPGILMPADPRRGESYRQEYYKGHAEDLARVLSVDEKTLVTYESTPLEPDIAEHKTYAAGVGTVGELAVKGSKERMKLVR